MIFNDRGDIKIKRGKILPRFYFVELRVTFENFIPYFLEKVCKNC